MFERLTDEARQAVCRAPEHARRLQHGWIGCEHLLLGVAGSPGAVGSLLRQHGARPEDLGRAIDAVIGCGSIGQVDDRRLLATLGIDADAVRHAVEATFGSGALTAPAEPGRRGRRRRLRRWRASCRATAGSLPFTPAAKRCLEQSLHEALRRRHDFIGVEHLALALLARDDTAAGQVLRHLGLDPRRLHRAVDQALRPPA